MFRIGHDRARDIFHALLRLRRHPAHGGLHGVGGGSHQLANKHDPGYRRAHQFIDRRRKLFGEPTSNSCSIDPGARVPFTVFDVDYRVSESWYTDFIARQRGKYEHIGERAGVHGPAAARVRPTRRRANTAAAMATQKAPAASQ